MDKNKFPKSTFQKNFPTNFFTFYIINQFPYLKKQYILYDIEERKMLHATTLGDDIVQIKSQEIPMKYLKFMALK